MIELSFYFDFLSPYAYFSSLRVESFCEKQGLSLRYCPVPLGAILGHWGHLGPAEIPPKREHTFRDCLLYAKRHGLGFGIPAQHPFNSIMALRCCIVENSGEHQPAVVRTLFHEGWQNGIDLGDPVQIAVALEKAGLPGQKIVERTQETEVKESLKTLCAEAIERGVFGVPTFAVNETIFWGNDQWENIELFLGDGELVDGKVLERLLATPIGVTRKKN